MEKQSILFLLVLLFSGIIAFLANRKTLPNMIHKYFDTTIIMIYLLLYIIIDNKVIMQYIGYSTCGLMVGWIKKDYKVEERKASNKLVQNFLNGNIIIVFCVFCIVIQGIVVNKLIDTVLSYVFIAVFLMSLILQAFDQSENACNKSEVI